MAARKVRRISWSTVDSRAARASASRWAAECRVRRPSSVTPAGRERADSGQPAGWAAGLDDCLGFYLPTPPG